MEYTFREYNIRQGKRFMFRKTVLESNHSVKSTECSTASQTRTFLNNFLLIQIIYNNIEESLARFSQDYLCFLRNVMKSLKVHGNLILM